MAPRGKERSATAEAILREADFAVSRRCISRPSCFDFAARREKQLIFVKIQPDIGSVALKDASELGRIAEEFSAASLLIGEETRERPLQDDTVYARYDILAVTLKTFENVVLHRVRPLIQASPGGYFVEIDGEALKQTRRDLGLSVGEIADMVSISRRTVYGYERGLAKASVPAAYNLMRTLGIPVGHPVDLFQKSKSKRCILTTAKLVFARNRLLNRILRRLAPLHPTTVKKAPFDFVLSIPEEKTRIIGGVTNADEPELNERADEILSVSEVVGAHPILITRGKRPSESNIPCISCEEFSRTRDPHALLASLREASFDAIPSRL